MKINEESRIQLIRYRLEQANECIDEVSFLLENKKFKIAVNRIYYGMFYSLLALALSEKYESSKHSQLLGWFNKNFIHTGILEVVYGKMMIPLISIGLILFYSPKGLHILDRATAFLKKKPPVLGQPERLKQIREEEIFCNPKKSPGHLFMV